MGVNFKIISVGWNCPQVVEQTLNSINGQQHPNWFAHIVDDGSGWLQEETIRDWIKANDAYDRFELSVNPENFGAVRSQYEGIRRMDPDDEDVIVFLDLDGDMLAHPHVLEVLEGYYSDDTLMTYGNYRPIVDLQPEVPSPVSPFPPEVIASNTYRQCLNELGARYNHLRTVKWKVLKEIPLSYFQWPDGRWLRSPTDLIVVAAALELSGGRYKCIERTLCRYNSEQPHPDNLRNQDENVRGSNYTFSLPPLQRLEI